MFDYLKAEIRKEINNFSVSDINDETAIKLRTIAKQAKKDRNFEKSIACQEMILDDVGIDNPNAFGQKITLLSEYDDCGYYNTKEALDLALNLLDELNLSHPGVVFPPVYIGAIKPLYCSNNKEHKELALQCAEKAFEIGKKLFNKNSNDESAKSTLVFSFRELLRIYFDQGKYQKAYDSFFTMPDEIFNAVDDIISCYIFIIELYGLSDIGTKHSDRALRNLKEMKDIPEANYILGIAYSEGFMVDQDLNIASKYFKTANNLAKSYRGTIGYTKYEFSVLSSISDDEIRRKAKAGNYHSKFYNAQYNAPQSKSANTPTPSSGSGGCYVATCVYGSYDCPEVWTLRRFRDNILEKHYLGRMFIKLYYAVSPKAVSLFGKYNWFHKIFKTPLDKLVKKLHENGVENTPYND